MEMDGNDKGGNGMENIETIYEADRLENKFFWQMHQKWF